MNTSRSLRFLFAFALAAAPALAQSGAQIAKDLKAKEAAAKKDPDQLFEVGKWATEKSLMADAKRLYQAVLKIKPDHPGANEALGNELVEGKWLPAKEAADLRKKARAAEFLAKGFVEVSGVWVEKDKAEDAKRGVFHHEGDLVTKDEMVALQAGKVRHPDTGELIDAKFLEKAQNKYFPVGSDRWVDQKGADAYHADVKRPWIVRTPKGTIVSTLPLAKIEELKGEVDAGIEKVMPLMGSKTLAPSRRPVVIVASTDSEFIQMGNEVGDGTDACGSFLMEEGKAFPVPNVGDVRAAICVHRKDWAPLYVRHCAALAYANGVAEEAGADLPLWLLHGIGSYTSRFQVDAVAGGFGKQHAARAGRDIKGFLAGFAISSELTDVDIAFNIFHAGLLVAFAHNGGDPKTTAALQALTAVLSGSAKGSAGKAITNLEAALIEAEPKIAAYLQQLIAKAQ
jgi:hypothetical protein